MTFSNFNLGATRAIAKKAFSFIKANAVFLVGLSAILGYQYFNLRNMMRERNAKRIRVKNMIKNAAYYSLMFLICVTSIIFGLILAPALFVASIMSFSTRGAMFANRLMRASFLSLVQGIELAFLAAFVHDVFKGSKPKEPPKQPQSIAGKIFESIHNNVVKPAVKNRNAITVAAGTALLTAYAYRASKTPGFVFAPEDTDKAITSTRQFHNIIKMS